MSSAFVSTPLGSLPKQDNFQIAGTFNTGFLEFDQNVVFLNVQLTKSTKVFIIFDFSLLRTSEARCGLAASSLIHCLEDFLFCQR